MENLEWTEGLGAIALTILILREVFGFLAKTKNGNGQVALDTNKTITRLEGEIRKVSSAINNLKENRKESQQIINEVRKMREDFRR